MIDSLLNLDSDLLIAINGMHSDYLDAFMWTVSKTYSWALIALVAITVNARKGWKPLLFFVLALAVAVLLADQVSSSIIKHAVERLRPTHDPHLEGMLHLVRDYRGGLYGFVSSHAANSMAIAILVGCMLPHRAALCSLLAWTCLQCYSRMYLGVHYPGDILGGIVVGLLAGAIAYRAWRYAMVRWSTVNEPLFTTRDSHAVTAAVWASVAVLATAAAI